MRIKMHLKKNNPDIRLMPEFKMAKNSMWTPSFIFYVREVIECKSLLENLVEDDDKLKLSWVEKSKGNSSGKIAEEMLRLIWGDEKPSTELGEWIPQVEEKLGITVMQLPRQRPDYDFPYWHEISGMALASGKLPIIVLNSENDKANRLFTLCYKIAHLMMGLSGISDDIYYPSLSSEIQPQWHSKKEKICYKAAVHVIIPEELIKSLQASSASKPPGDGFDTIMDHFGAPSVVIARYFMRPKLMESKETRQIFDLIVRWKLMGDAKKNKNQEKLESHEKGNFSFRQAKIAEDRAGPRMTRRALEAYDDGRLSATDLYDIFRVKLNHLPTIAENCGHSLVRWQGRSS